jgi:hypothetical protein
MCLARAGIPSCLVMERKPITALQLLLTDVGSRSVLLSMSVVRTACY